MGVLDALARRVDGLGAIDHHAHLLAADPTAGDLASLLTESREQRQIDQVRHHPAHHRAVRDLARLLGTDATEEAIAEVRAGTDPPAFVRRLLDAARIEAMFVDDGFRFPAALSLDEHAAVVERPVRRVLRIETTAEEAAAGWPPFSEACARFGDAIGAAFRSGAVALKTIAAYRCGLDLPAADPVAARAAYEGWRGSGSERLADSRLVSFFLAEALDATGARIPLQVHTGIGDHDLVLARSDPSLLRPLLEDRRHTGRPIVLLHCYPFVRQAGWLASVYPDVHLDVSLAIPLVAHRGRELVLEALELAPATKVLFGTDASRRPEMWFLAARWWRDALTRALAQLVDDDLIDGATASEWAALVLAGNARRLYLGGSATHAIGDPNQP